MLSETDGDKILETVPPRSSSVGHIPRLKRARTAPARLADELADARVEFLELALHDLQTPAAVLDLSLKLLAGDLSSADTETLATLRGAERAVRRIQQHIDHLVTSERLSSGRLQPRRQRIDLAPLLDQLVSDYAEYARAEGVTIDLDLESPSSLRLCADEVLLSRIFQNLLENSLRHAGKNGRVLIKARAGSVIELQICNDGPSVPLAEREQIFHKYFGNAQASRTSGLGLYFCRLAVRSHGGTITLQDSPSWPTCFVIRLPVAAITRRG